MPIAARLSHRERLAQQPGQPRGTVAVVVGCAETRTSLPPAHGPGVEPALDAARARRSPRAPRGRASRRGEPGRRARAAAGDASEPIIVVGRTARATPSARAEHVARRAARARGCAPSARASRRAAAPPRKRMHSGSASHAVGSTVPVQSNSSRKRAAVLLRVVAVADHERVQRRLPVAPHVQEGRALGRAQPLVRVAACSRRRRRASSVERHHAGRVRAVDQRVDAARRAARAPAARPGTRARSGWSRGRAARASCAASPPRARARRSSSVVVERERHLRDARRARPLRARRSAAPCGRPP